ncbi:Hypothetical protein LUCI_2032 [Lucifera butyrica]|uniref:Membrane-bound metal-dependent hydrolase n=1 Tax=Lucifera butyrica TaxID=1351585 RepID=A0A498R2E3_9FIRM|nr:metal-dependent hydrolase [Lucifera butyrica]VBB06796.1 Hypothetical protein LUCI_2032 [Lucifera butyrica]
MDTMAHALIGFAIAGLSGHQPSLSDPVYIATALGAQAPDFDIIAQVRGNLAYLRQHRSFSHSVPGIVLWSVLISVGIYLIMPHANYIQLFGWSLAGSFSHIITDYFNTHGAALFWPFKRERKSFPLLKVFDPLLLLMMSGTFLFHLPVKQIAGFILSILFMYTGLRYVLRVNITRHLLSSFNHSVDRIWVMPSLKRVFYWDFVIETKTDFIVGEIASLLPQPKIRATLPRQAFTPITIKACETRLGDFFRTFSPFLYFENDEDVASKKVRIYDLRYFLNQQFLHSATIIFGDNDQPCASFIHSSGRTVRIPC